MSKTLPATLPELTRARLLESLRTRPVLKDGAIDEPEFKKVIEAAATAEIEYLAKITGSGQIRGMGASTVTEADAASATAKLEESFRSLGMGEAEIKIAVAGR